jgi:hypothetical protein
VVNQQGGFDVVGQHTYSNGGSFLFTVTVKGPSGISSKPIGTAKVIILTATAEIITATSGQPFNGKVAYFRSIDQNSLTEEYNAIIAWGDDTTSPGTIISNGKGSFNVNGLHRYLAPGTYSFTVIIQGPVGSSATATGTAEVGSNGILGRTRNKTTLAQAGYQTFTTNARKFTMDQTLECWYYGDEEDHFAPA